MKPKTVVTVLLLAFVAFSVVALIVSETRSRRGSTETDAGPVPESGVVADGAEAAPSDASPEETGVDRKIIAYYFHGDARCRTCRKIEAYTSEAIASGFAAELASGKLEWRIVNVDKPDHEHFVKDYDLTTRSVVLADAAKGGGSKWRNLVRIWDLVGDKDAFQEYIARETAAALKGND